MKSEESAKNFKLNLEENYGQNWLFPDVDYIPHLESPSTVDKSGDVYRLVTRFLLIQALQKNNLQKAQRIINIALQNDDEDFKNGCLTQPLKKVGLLTEFILAA